MPNNPIPLWTRWEPLRLYVALMSAQWRLCQHRVSPERARLRKKGRTSASCGVDGVGLSHAIFVRFANFAVKIVALDSINAAVSSQLNADHLARLVRRFYHVGREDPTKVKRIRSCTDS